MRTTTIRYRRLESHKGGYGHDAVEIEVELAAGDDPEAVFLDLRKQVLARLGHITDLHLLTESIENLQRRRDRLDATIAEQKALIDRNRQIIQSHDDLAELARDRGVALEAAETLLGEAVPF